MRIALAHFKTQTLQHLRSPGYLLPTLAMPGLFYSSSSARGLPKSGPPPGSGSCAPCRYQVSSG